MISRLPLPVDPRRTPAMAAHRTARLALAAAVAAALLTLIALMAHGA